MRRISTSLLISTRGPANSCPSPVGDLEAAACPGKGSALQRLSLPGALEPSLQSTHRGAPTRCSRTQRRAVAAFYERGLLFLYNCTTVADIMDFERSKLSYLNKSTILEIDHLEVHEDRLGASPSSRWRVPGRCCVTDGVARRIREARLEGFEFRKLWPLPEEVPYSIFAPKARNAMTS